LELVATVQRAVSVRREVPPGGTVPRAEEDRMDHDTGRSNALPRQSALVGLTRALVATLGAQQAVPVLITEFGWDVTFQTLAALEGDDGDAAFAAAWEHVLTGAIALELDGWY
jgi:hypothetical protein